MSRPDYPIVTRRLVIRPFVSEDLDHLHAMQSLPEVARYLYWEPRNREQVRQALERKIAQSTLEREGEALTLAVVLPEPEGRLIGEVNLDWISEQHGQGEIGFVFHPGYQGCGYAREAAEEMLRLAFTGLGLHRVFGRCDPRNTSSAALMRRLGMRQEACFRHKEIFKGEWGDEAHYAILAEEWSPRA